MLLNHQTSKTATRILTTTGSGYQNCLVFGDTFEFRRWANSILKVADILMYLLVRKVCLKFYVHFQGSIARRVKYGALLGWQATVKCEDKQFPFTQKNYLRR